MHLELVELLRCPVPHASGVLVAATDSIANRYMTEGLLGCPECHAEYAVRDGLTTFEAHESAEFAGPPAPDPMHLAAQLGLNAGRAVFAVVGFDLDTVDAMRDIVAARMLVFNPPPADLSAPLTGRVQTASLVAPLGVALCGGVLPLVSAKFDGIAVASTHPLPTLLEQAAAALRTGGRLVAGVNGVVPAGMRELVRDEHVWVAERKSVASAPVGITRR